MHKEIKNVKKCKCISRCVKCGATVKILNLHTGSLSHPPKQVKSCPSCGHIVQLEPSSDVN